MLSMYLPVIKTEDEKRKFEIIYKKYKRLMFYVANGILHNPQDAEDIVARVFEKIIDMLEEFVDIECHKTKYLIVLMVRNYSINLYNQNKRRMAVPYETLENTQLFDEMDSNAENSLAHQISKLSSIYRDVLNLKYVYGYSNDEIAKAFDITEAAVRKRLQRAKEILREQMEKE